MGGMLIRYKPLRRALGAALIVIGAVLMWFAPEVWSGVALLVVGVALEIAGITLEYRAGRAREDRHAVER